VRCKYGRYIEYPPKLGAYKAGIPIMGVYELILQIIILAILNKPINQLR